MVRYLLLTTIIFLLSATIFYITITRLDPFSEQNEIAYFSFFFSIFIFIASFFTFFFFFTAELFSQINLGMQYYLISIRRGTLISVFLTTLLGLKLLQILGIVEIVLLGVFLILLEIIFSTQNN